MKQLLVFPDASQATFTDDELLEFNTIVADLIICGTVLTDATDVTLELPTAQGNGPTVSNENFQIQVNEVWFGECEDEVIELGLLQGVKEPQKGDVLILFLIKKASGGYTTTDYENSIFAINPPNDRLFSFSTREGMSRYDGVTPESFKETLQSIFDKFEKEAFNVNFIGRIANELLPDDSYYKKTKEYYEAEAKGDRDAMRKALTQQREKAELAKVQSSPD